MIARPADRNGWIDCLRALASIGVALFHLNLVVPAPVSSSLASTWQSCWRFGYLGVPVFFVISGYCIILTWAKSRHAGDFALRRSRRILPAYWASLVLVIALAAAFRLLRGVNDVSALPATPAAIAATLVLLTAPATPVKTINWVYWSLVAEAAFYVVCSILLLLPTLRPTRIWRMVATHCLLCGLALLPNIPRTGVLFFVPLWPMFGLGAALATRQIANRAGLVMLAVSGLHLIAEIGWRGIDNGSLVAATATCAALAFALPHRLPAWLAPLAKLGALSYSLYLIHVPLGLYGILRMLPEHSTSLASFLSLQLSWLVLVSISAWLFWLLFERPFLRPAVT